MDAGAGARLVGYDGDILRDCDGHLVRRRTGAATGAFHGQGVLGADPGTGVHFVHVNDECLRAPGEIEAVRRDARAEPGVGHVVLLEVARNERGRVGGREQVGRVLTIHRDGDAARHAVGARVECVRLVSPRGVRPEKAWPGLCGPAAAGHAGAVQAALLGAGRGRDAGRW